MKWSASANGFYSEENTVIPDDAIEISDDTYQELLNGNMAGKIITTGDAGLPVLIDRPKSTHDEFVAAANIEKQERIDEANEYMNSKQWPGKAAIGRLKGDELLQYNLWLDYLDALEVVDTSSAPRIEWPTPPVEQAS